MENFANIRGKWAILGSLKGSQAPLTPSPAKKKVLGTSQFYYRGGNGVWELFSRTMIKWLKMINGRRHVVATFTRIWQLVRKERGGLSSTKQVITG